ncbi:MAG TPA: hypothetical protein VIL86_07990 [Tepidisphaeraceae bacterium]|jgi:hypothetical protein
MPDDVTQLHYAPRAPWHHRRRTRRSILLLALALIIASGYFWAPRYYNHLRLLYWQRQCADFIEPPETVAYDSTTGNAPPHTSAAWQNFYSLYSPPGAKPNSILFLHRLQTASGKSYLITLEEIDNFENALGKRSVLLTYRLFALGSITRSPRQLRAANDVIVIQYKYVFFNDSRQATFRIFSGQPDRSDPSHFTITYDVDGKSETLDGWLTDDETVLLQPRTPSRP